MGVLGDASRCLGVPQTPGTTQRGYWGIPWPRPQTRGTEPAGLYHLTSAHDTGGVAVRAVAVESEGKVPAVVGLCGGVEVWTHGGEHRQCGQQLSIYMQCRLLGGDQRAKLYWDTCLSGP